MFLSRLLIALLSILTLTSESVLAVSYPSTGPGGSYSGGTFGTYLQNLFTNPCPNGEAVVGFSTGSTNYGEPICSSVGLAAGSLGDTLRFDGSSWVANDIIYNDGVNVGIGDSSPASKLDVRGILTVNPNAFGDAINFYNGYKIRTVGGGGLQLQGSPYVAIGNTSGINGATFSVGDIGAATLTLYPDAGQDGFEISGYNFIVDSSGRLGLGNLTPNAKLDIASTIDNAIRINKTGGTNWSYMEWLYGGTRRFWQGLNSTGNYALQSDSSTGQIFISGSRISIGVDSPQYRLDVAPGYVNSASGYCIGGDCIPAWSNVGDFINGNPGYLAGYDFIGTLGSSNTYQSGNQLYIGDVAYILSGSMTNLGQLSIYSATPTSITNPMISFGQLGYPDCKIWVNASSVLESNCSFGILNTTLSLDPNQIVRTDAYGTGLAGSVIYESGSNIGIGTTTPGARLEVNGQIKVTGGSPGAGKILTSDATGLASWQTPGAVSFTGVVSFNGRTGAVIGASGDYTAGQITNVAGGNIIATNLQSAINELDSEKQVVITGAATSVTLANLLANAALVSDAGGKISASATISSTELGYLDNISSNIQTQIDAKEPTITAGVSTQYYRGDKTWQTLNTAAVTEGSNLYYTNARVWASLSGAISPYLTGNLTPSRALASDTNGKLSVANTTLTELNYVNGVTSSIQTQLNSLSTNKANLASPNFTGTPTVPTAATGANDTQIANTAFVNTAITNGIASGALVGNFWYLSGNTIGANDFIGTKNPRDLRFVYSGSEGMRLSQTGLSVNGALQVGNSLYVSNTPGGTNTLYGPAAGFLVLGVNNSTAMTINSSNNVGIGPLAPTRNFEVSAGNQLTFRLNSGNASLWDFYMSYGMDDNLYVNPYAGTGNFIFSGTNVGIGTVAATERLTVAGTGSFQGLRLTSGASNGYILTSDASGNARWAPAGGSVSSVFGRTGAVIGASGDYTAGQITNIAAGNIAATNLQAAINELDTEKEPSLAAGVSTQYYRGDKTWQTLNTTAVTEGTNLYFTNARVGAALTGAISNTLTGNLTINSALISDANGKIAVSSTVSSTELGYLDGVTSVLQPQLNARWSLSGNAIGVNDFIGTTNTRDFIIKVNNIEHARFIGTGSIILGRGNSYSGEYSTILGYQNALNTQSIASNIGNTIIGYGNSFTGGTWNSNNTLIGSNNIGGSGFGGMTVVGRSNTSNGFNGVILGVSNNIPTVWDESVLVGISNTTNGHLGNAFGYGNTVGGYSYAIGMNNTVNGYSYVLGLNNVSSAFGAIIIGSGITNNIANSIQIGPNDSAKITVLSGGQVGIGTSSPTAKLEVVGTIKITGGSPGAGRVLTSDATGLASWQSLSGASVSSVFGRTGSIIGASGDYTAGQITNVAVGNIAATNVQAALNELDTEKQVTITGAASTVTLANLTANSALVSDAGGKIGVSPTISSTELGYLDNATSNIQTQIDSKLNSGSVSGTSNYISKFNGANSITNSQIYDNGTTVGIGIAPPPGPYKLNVNGNAYIAGDLTLTGSLYVDNIVNRNVTNLTISGNILPDSNAPLSYRNIGSDSTRWNNLYLSGQITIGGGSPGVGKYLTSDANGLASWTTLTIPADAVTSVFGRTGTVIGSSGDYTAGQITNIAAGNIAATNLQAAINELDTEKQVTITGAASSVTLANLTASRALSSDATGKIAVATTTLTELNYVNGVTSAIQPQLNARWSLSGNSVGVNDFIGTTNDLDLIFKRNNVTVADFSTGGNLALGAAALASNTFGINNVAIGSGALRFNTGGSNNTAIGYQALTSNISGGSNTANGIQSLYYNTSGSNNTANGVGTLYSNTTGNFNTANGVGTLYYNTSGSSNTANGSYALNLNSTGGYNTANGVQALYSNTTGNFNTANGYNALLANTTGNNNTANGVRALNSNITGTGNVALGYESLYSATGVSFQTALGYQALRNTTGTQNLGIGYQAGSGITSGSNNIAIGFNAQVQNGTASNQLNIGDWIYGSGGNIGIGQSTNLTDRLVVAGTGSFQGLRILSGASDGFVLTSDATGNARWAAVPGGGNNWSLSGNAIGVNDFIGSTNIQDVIIKTNNVTRFRVTGTGGSIIGLGNSLTAGTLTNSLVLGNGAGNALDGSNHIVLGGLNGGYIMGGNSNTAIGGDAAGYLSAGSYNTSLGGQYAGYGSNGAYNASFGGRYAGFAMSGSYNVAIGTYAGSGITSGQNNVYIGTYAIGNAGQSNQFSIGNVIYGSGMGTGGIANGMVGIGTMTPTAKLEVVGGDAIINGVTVGIGKNGSQSTALGSQALGSNTTGLWNTAIGYMALTNNTGGAQNVALGTWSLRNNTTGLRNTGLGMSALYNNTGGSYNTAVGNEALIANNVGSHNTSLGFYALPGLTSGTGNTAIGSNAGSNQTSGNSNIIIGYNAQVPNITGSNQLSIGNWIYGNAGDIGIGTNNPTAKLEIAGQIKITGGVPGAGKVLTSDATGLATWQSMSGTSVSSVFGRTGAVLGASGDYTAGQITNVAAGNIAATNVQAALNELDTEKAPLASPALTGTPTAPTPLLSDSGTTIATTAFVKSQGYLSAGGNIVTSFNGRTGAVVPTSGDYTTTQVTEGTNLYFTNARVGAALTGAISTTLTGNLATSRALASDAGGKISVATTTLTELNYVNGVTSSIQAQLNNKISTGSISGSTNYLPRFSGTNALTNSQLFDNGTAVGIGTATPGSYKLNVNGDTYISGSLSVLGRLYVDTIVNRTVTNISVSGGIIPDTAAPLSVRNLGSNGTRWNNLYLSGQITIGGGAPGAGKYLTSDANGLASWTTLTIPADAVTSVFGRTGTVIGASGDYTAGQITNVAAGNIAATNVQAALNELDTEKQVTITGAASSVTLANLTTSRALSSDATGKIAVATTTLTELNYVNGVTSAIQPQLNARWSLSGNAIGVNDFIGTTNDQDLILKRNNITVADFSTGSNLALGQAALSSNTTGIYNVAIGSGALNANISGQNNIAIGSDSLGKNTTGLTNTAIGSNSLFTNSTGSWHTAIGYNALAGNTSGYSNTALGNNSLQTSTTGYENTAVGRFALYNLTTGNQNTAVGYNTLQTNITGTGITALGYDANVGSTNLINATAIGYKALVSTSDSLVLGSGANVGIGTSSPTSKLDVVGTGTFQGLRILSGASDGFVLTSDASGNARWAAAATGGWGLTGNAGTNPSTNFLGTTDSQDFVIRANNNQVARFYTGGNLNFGLQNTLINALKSTVIGYNNSYTGSASYDGDTVIGYNNRMNNGYGAGLVVGSSNISNSSNGITVGSSNNVNGDDSTVFGRNNTLGTHEAILIGASNNVSGGATYSWSLGYGYGNIVQATVNSSPVSVFGRSNTGSTGNVVAFGNYNNVIRQNGTAVGQYNNVTTSGSSVFGSFISNAITGSTMIGPNDTAKVTILSSGDLGIGTSAPTSKLDVVGTGTFQGLRILSGASNGFVLTSDASGNARWAAATGGGGGGSGWSLSGNAIGANDFLGTTNDRDLILKRNNIIVADFSLSGNLAFGQAALSSVTTGTFNIAIGSGSLRSNTTGGYNTANGAFALYSNSGGNYNTANGSSALYLNTIGNYNTANGVSALYSNTTGSGNVAIGSEALYSSTGVNFQTAVGYQALRNSTSGFWNTAIGYKALTVNTTGISNTSLGYNTLAANLTGDYNVALGTNALAANTSGSSNHALGTTALSNNTTGSDNIAVGNNAFYASLTGSQNVALGSNAGFLLKSGDKNILIGNGAGLGSTGAYYSENTIVGHSAGFSLFTGSYNTLMGFRAGTDISGGANNTLIGYSAGRNITNGSNHIALGYQALERNVGSATPSNLPNIAIGYEALRGGAILASNNTAYDNVALGYQALRGTIATASTGYQNTAIGNLSLSLNTSGYWNTAAGVSSLLVNTTGDGNTAYGFQSLFTNSTGSNNTAIGLNALYTNTTGLRNIALGYKAGSGITTGSNNISIGYDSQVQNGTASNQMSIGNLIYALGMTGAGLGNVGIGITNPSETLTVSGNVLANGYLYTSDERLKKDISTLTDVDTILSSLRGVSFEWKSNNRKDIGFIAQEVETILPELVHSDASGMKSVQYGNIIPLLVEGYKAEKTRADSLEERIELLESRLDRIESTNQ